MKRYKKDVGSTASCQDWIRWVVQIRWICWTRPLRVKRLSTSSRPGHVLKTRQFFHFFWWEMDAKCMRNWKLKFSHSAIAAMRPLPLSPMQLMRPGGGFQISMDSAGSERHARLLMHLNHMFMLFESFPVWFAVVVCVSCVVWCLL